MSSFNPHHHTCSLRRARRRARRRLLWVVGVLGALAVAIGLSAVLTTADDSGSTVASTGASGHAGHMDETLPPGYRLTGTVSPMGGQVIETPGTRAGAAAAGGVIVTDGADITMGHIPLAFAVNPTWHLRNTSDQPVTLGRPKVTVVKGCCPAEPVLGATTLAPGAETTLQFPTQMHPGMDGDHLFRLAVPISGATDPLTVSVAGDFS
jgi:hypothetical protein